MDGNNLGEGIKNLRIAQGMTQEELAKRINVSKATVSAYENGSRLPSYGVLIKLSQLFHVSTDSLLGVGTKQFLDVTGITPRQQNTLCEIIAAYRALNKNENPT